MIVAGLRNLIFLGISHTLGTCELASFVLVPHYTFPAHIILSQRRVHIPDIQVTAGDVHAVVPRSHLQQHPLQGRPFRAHAANQNEK